MSVSAVGKSFVSQSGMIYGESSFLIMSKIISNRSLFILISSTLSFLSVARLFITVLNVVEALRRQVIVDKRVQLNHLAQLRELACLDVV